MGFQTISPLLSFVDEHISELSTHEGIDMSKSRVWTYRKIRKNLAEFIGEKYRLTDLAFGQLTEPFISDFHHYLLDEKGFSSGTITICKLAETSKTYSYHSGRHSFASLITLEAGVPMETICKMLGHKDVKMTQRYARVTQKKLFEDMDKFIAATEKDFVLAL